MGLIRRFWWYLCVCLFLFVSYILIDLIVFLHAMISGLGAVKIARSQMIREGWDQGVPYETVCCSVYF